LSCRRFGAFAPVVAACGAGLYTWLFRGKGDTQPSDFQPLWEATRAWWHGINPYTIPGPFEWSHHYLAYPMPAVLVASPFAALPLRWAETLFVALGFGALAFVLTRDRWRRPGPPWVFASIVGVFVAQHAQWSMLMTAAPFVPAALGFVLVCKPTIGLALFAARPSKAAARGCAVVTVVSLLVFPGWPKAWWEATRPIANVVGAPVMHLGGVLVLAALARWRRADARLLVALALVPQTPMIHEAVPLFLIAETLEEGAILAMLTLVAFAALFRLGPYPDQSAFYAMSGRLMVWCLYLPATIIVCRRPNVATALLEARD
jgi:hypothetical protein